MKDFLSELADWGKLLAVLIFFAWLCQFVQDYERQRSPFTIKVILDKTT